MNDRHTHRCARVGRVPRAHRLRCPVAAILLGLALLASRSAGASLPAWDPVQALADQGWRWTREAMPRLPGADVTLYRFQARQPPLEVARRLLASGPARFARLQWAGGVLLLSGGQGPSHWLAQLQGDPQGTRGLLSSLTPAAPPSGMPTFDAARLVPPGARQVLRTRDDGQAAGAVLSAFDCDGTLAQVEQALRRALQKDHWQPEQAAVRPLLDGLVPDGLAPGGPESGGLVSDGPPPAGLAPGISRWRHAQLGGLALHIRPRTSSVAVTFWHYPRETP
ncbi:hypothetical protein [Castellaniella caeni]|uniref:hypothetical protein n=1 Tax=Castellaniella caeni TaxID=266123 RepID=UPI0011AF2992|nr:hypothetical protein [Castellaniella caeni]